MKLLMISTDRKIFEHGSAVRERMVEYAKSCEELHIIVFANKTFCEQVLSPNCWVYPTRSISKWFYPFNAIRLGRFIIEKRKITNITCQDPFLTAMAGISLKKQFNIPLEIQVHTDIGSPNYTKAFGNKFRKALALSYLPKADTVRVVSERIKKYLINPLGIDSAKITIRPIQVNTGWIKTATIKEGANLYRKYSQFDKVILMASRLEKEKNIKLAIRAFAKVAHNFSKVGLVIVGSGSQEGNLRKLASSLAPENVIFEAWADRETLASYYKTAHVFLNTSFYEGYGMTLVEAQAASCSIVSTDVGVANEIGATIIPFDENEIARTLIDVLNIK